MESYVTNRISDLEKRVESLNFENSYVNRKTSSKMFLLKPVLTISLILGILLSLTLTTNTTVPTEEEHVVVLNNVNSRRRDVVIETTISVKEQEKEEIKSLQIPASTVYTGAYADKNVGKLYNALIEADISNICACAILGNLIQESGGCSTDFSKNDISTTEEYEGHKGIAQWDSGRYKELGKWCSKMGVSVDSIEGQISFLIAEATNPKVSWRAGWLKDTDSKKGGNPESRKDISKNFFEETDLDKATKTFALCFEGCVDSSQYGGLQELKNRQKFAKECYKIFVEGKK